MKAVLLWDVATRVHGHSMACQHREYSGEEAVGHGRGKRPYLDEGDVGLVCHGGEGRRGPPVEVDERSFPLGRERVFDPQEHIPGDGVLDGRRVDDARPEVGELHRLAEAHLGQDLGGPNQVGVSRVHAVHVGPDHHFRCVQGGSEKCRGEIGSPPAQRGGAPARLAPDEALDHGHRARVEKGPDALGSQPSNGVDVRDGGAESGVRPDDTPGVLAGGRHALGRQRRHGQLDRKVLAGRHQLVPQV